VACRVCSSAKEAGTSFWQVGGVLVSVPRHRDINEWTAEGIMRDLEPMLGKDWWRA